MSKKSILSVVLVLLMCLSLCSCRDEYGNSKFFKDDNKLEHSFGGESQAETDSTDMEEVSSTVESEPEKKGYTVTYSIEQGKTSLMDATETIVLCDVDINIPVFSITFDDGVNNTPVTKKINEVFYTYAYELSLLAEDFAKEAQANYYDCIEYDIPFVPYSMTLSPTVTRRDNIISVKATYSEYRGGVHPSTIFT